MQMSNPYLANDKYQLEMMQVERDVGDAGGEENSRYKQYQKLLRDDGGQVQQDGGRGTR